MSVCRPLTLFTWGGLRSLLGGPCDNICVAVNEIARLVLQAGVQVCVLIHYFMFWLVLTLSIHTHGVLLLPFVLYIFDFLYSLSRYTFACQNQNICGEIPNLYFLQLCSGTCDLNDLKLYYTPAVCETLGSPVTDYEQKWNRGTREMAQWIRDIVTRTWVQVSSTHLQSRAWSCKPITPVPWGRRQKNGRACWPPA